MRDRARRLVDEAVIDAFDFDLVVGPTLVLVADPDARRALPEAVADTPHGGQTGCVHVFDLYHPELLPVPVQGPWETVILLASDRSDLRRIVPAIPRVGSVGEVVLWMTATRVPVGLVPHPEWPRLVELESRRLHDNLPGVVLRVTFARRAHARAVLRQLAVQSAAPGGSHPGLFTGYLRQVPEPGLDLGAQLFAEAADLADHDLVVPRDVLVARPGAPAAETEVPHEHHVLGRRPVVVSDVAVEPVDETIFNPVRWNKRATSASIELRDLVRRSGHVAEGDMRRARAHRSVLVDLAEASVQDTLRLAMAGIPLEARGLEAARASGRLAGVSPDLLDLLATSASGAVDLDDALEREEFALRLRRATFDAHSTLAHRAARAGQSGVGRQRSATAGLPAVSIMLATRREHELANALESVRKQVGAEIELVVATHGFSADEVKLRELLGEEHGLTLLTFDAETRFGDVLTAAAQATSNDVVMKMDDDDWYSPHAVHDLLMARRFSGADLVGMPTEFVYLAQYGETVRRREPAETFSSHVAGGTMTLSRDLLREVGWFRPVRRWVDAQLLASVHAVGGTAYRTHGLGYVLVRNEEGHTWAQDADEFRLPEHVDRIFAGFRAPNMEPGASPATVLTPEQAATARARARGASRAALEEGPESGDDR